MNKILITVGAGLLVSGCIVEPSQNPPQSYSTNQPSTYNAPQSPSHGGYNTSSYQGSQQPSYNPADALVPGTNYHATGQVPCSMGGGQPTGSCSFGVQRQGNGSAMVTVTKSDGRTRTIFFSNGQATGYDQSQADMGRFSATKQSDLYIITIGEERYEIPEAVIFGG